MKQKPPATTFIARAFITGCSFRVVAFVLFIIFGILSNPYKADDLNPVANFVGTVLAVILLFDVTAPWPNKPLVDLVADPELGYRPQPYLFVILPLCLLVGTLLIGLLLVGAKLMVTKLAKRNSNERA